MTGFEDHILVGSDTRGSSPNISDHAGQPITFETNPNAIFDLNISIIRTRFPRVAGQLLDNKKGRGEISVQQTEEGAVTILNGLCQDHPSKPISAAGVWAQRTILDERLKNAKNLIIYGFGSGYHVKALMPLTEAQLIVVEPSIDVLRAALYISDLSDCLSKIRQ